MIANPHILDAQSAGSRRRANPRADRVAQPGQVDRLGPDGVDRHDLVDPEADGVQLPAQLAPGVEVDLHAGDPAIGHAAVAGVGAAEQRAQTLAEEPPAALGIGAG